MLEDNWPLVLLGLRVGVAVALYLFLLTAVRALRAEVRARTTPFRTQAVTVSRAAVPAAAPPRPPMPAPSVEVVSRRRHDRGEVVAYEGNGAGEASGLTGRSYDLDGPVLIGRGAGNTIVLPERHVSARHARLVPQDDGWWVEDLGSTNGTYIGRHRVAGRERLDPTMEVRFGPVVARLVRTGTR